MGLVSWLLLCPSLHECGRWGGQSYPEIHISLRSRDMKGVSPTCTCGIVFLFIMKDYLGEERHFNHYTPVAAAAVMLLQSCPILCNPIDGSPPGSPIPGILQARTLELEESKLEEGQCWLRCGATGIPIHNSWESKMSCHFGRQFGGFLQNWAYSYHVIQQSHSLEFTQRNWKFISTQKPAEKYL